VKVNFHANEVYILSLDYSVAKPEERRHLWASEVGGSSRRHVVMLTSQGLGKDEDRSGFVQVAAWRCEENKSPEEHSMKT
jgi:hypothetical protein